MTNQEKVKLIGNMIGDFWELCCDADHIHYGADALVSAIFSVVAFEDKETEDGPGSKK